MKKAIVIGAKGQDGKLLVARLLRQNYTVISIARNTIECSDDSIWPFVDILDAEAVRLLIEKFMPDEVYYLAAYHHSSDNKALTDLSLLWNKSFQINVNGLTNVLESIRLTHTSAKLFYASSCLVYGYNMDAPQTEHTPFAPEDVYGISKMTGNHICHYYRNHHNLFASVGILYNHESSLRGANFVSQKIIQGALSIQRGESHSLALGDLSAEIDWGYAPNYVEAMQLILQLDEGEDFIIATGKTQTVQDFVETTFKKLNMDWTQYVTEDSSLIHRRRGRLQGNPEKLKQMTGWAPTVSFEEMIHNMLQGSCA